MVRLSLGVYNTRDDVDALVHMLERITRQDFLGDYRPVADSGGYMPAGYEDAILSRFSLAPRESCVAAVICAAAASQRRSE
jgi:hypothetical protein